MVNRKGLSRKLNEGRTQQGATCQTVMTFILSKGKALTWSYFTTNLNNIIFAAINFLNFSDITYVMLLESSFTYITATDSRATR